MLAPKDYLETLLICCGKSISFLGRFYTSNDETL
jgi:hypothetical protein